MNGLPKRGEIWYVTFDPAVGAEQRKTRPAVVLSIGLFERLGTRVVVPLTTWRPRFAAHPNKVLVPASDSNGLAEDSAADVLQIRAVAAERFVDQVGTIDESALDTIVDALAFAVGFKVPRR
jgi:mRNA interferase MazF